MLDSKIYTYEVLKFIIAPPVKLGVAQP